MIMIMMIIKVTIIENFNLKFNSVGHFATRKKLRTREISFSSRIVPRGLSIAEVL